MPFRRGEKADGAVHAASLIPCCRQGWQGYGYLQDWHLAPQSALPRTSQISRQWIFSQPGPPAMQISQNLLSNPVVSQSRAVVWELVECWGHPWMVLGIPGTLPWSPAGLGRIWIKTQRVRSEVSAILYWLWFQVWLSESFDRENISSKDLFGFGYELSLMKTRIKIISMIHVKNKYKINKHFIPAECRIIFLAEKQLYQFCDWGLGERVQQQRGCLILPLFIPAGMTMPTSFKAGL